MGGWSPIPNIPVASFETSPNTSLQEGDHHHLRSGPTTMAVPRNNSPFLPCIEAMKPPKELSPHLSHSNSTSCGNIKYPPRTTTTTTTTTPTDPSHSRSPKAWPLTTHSTTVSHINLNSPFPVLEYKWAPRSLKTKAVLLLVLAFGLCLYCSRYTGIDEHMSHPWLIPSSFDFGAVLSSSGQKARPEEMYNDEKKNHYDQEDGIVLPPSGKLLITDRLLMDMWIIRTAFSYDLAAHRVEASNVFDDLVDFALSLSDAVPTGLSGLGLVPSICLDHFVDQLGRLRHLPSSELKLLPPACPSVVERKGTENEGFAERAKRLVGHPSSAIWDLIHSLAALKALGCQAAEGTTAACSPVSTHWERQQILNHLSGIMEFIFTCEDCRLHFEYQLSHQMFDMVAWTDPTSPSQSEDNTSLRLSDILGGSGGWTGLSLWLWRLHNSVNLRTAQEYCPASTPSSLLENPFFILKDVCEPSYLLDDGQPDCGVWRKSCTGPLSDIDPVWPERDVQPSSKASARTFSVTLADLKNECQVRAQQDGSTFPFMPDMFDCDPRAYDIMSYVDVMYPQESDIVTFLQGMASYLLIRYA